MTATLRFTLAMALTGLFLLPSWGRAQTTVTQQRIGSTTFYSGTVGGQSLSGTSQSLGSFQYTTGSDGSRAVTQRIGDLRFTTVSPAYRPPGTNRW